MAIFLSCEPSISLRSVAFRLQWPTGGGFVEAVVGPPVHRPAGKKVRLNLLDELLAVKVTMRSTRPPGQAGQGYRSCGLPKRIWQ